MELDFRVKLPCHFGEIVDDYLKVMSKKKAYKGYTVSDNLEVVECLGVIDSNGSWNYHNNYDDSKLELAIITSVNSTRSKWFTLDRKEAEKVQQENIERYTEILNNELLRLKSLK